MKTQKTYKDQQHQWILVNNKEGQSKKETNIDDQQDHWNDGGMMKEQRSWQRKIQKDILSNTIWNNKIIMVKRELNKGEVSGNRRIRENYSNLLVKIGYKF